jgi:hypothetical protein
MKRFLLILTLLLSPSSLFAWGEKGHEIVSEAATFGTPAAMPAFFHRAYPRLIYLSNQPDRWKGGGEAIDAANSPDHFLDYEYVDGLKLTSDRYEYLHELERSGRLQRFRIRNSTPGFLPWRIAELAEQLTEEWRLWRAATDVRQREHIESNIIFLSGVLGHFVGDVSNPHHTTLNYNGWVQDNPEHFRYDCDTHSRFETDFVNNNISVEMVEPLLASLEYRPEEAFVLALASVRSSHGLLKTLYRIDRDGGFDGTGNEEGRRFAMERLAAGASMLRDVWYSAYVNSAHPPPERP